MKNILTLPLGLYVEAQEKANKEGITLVELCQRACVCKIDEVKALKPDFNIKDKTMPTHSPETGLEA